MKLLGILWLILLALTIAGCGSQRHTGPLYRQEVNLDNYKVIQLPYRGSYVYCIQFHDGGHSSRAIAGLACDFYKFWKDREWQP